MTVFQTKLQTFLASILISITPLLMHLHALKAEFGMQVIGVLMLFILFYSNGQKGNVSNLIWLFIVVSLISVAIYIVPIPEEIWLNLEGRATYRQVTRFVAEQLDNKEVYFTLSVIAENTKGALFYLIPLVAMFLVVMSLPIKHIKILVTILLIMVAFEAALGILQYSTGSVKFYMSDVHGSNASGTYASYDHYVILFELTIPIVIGALVSKIEKKSINDSIVSKIIFLIVLMIGFLIASFLSASRAGIGSVLIGLFVASFIYAFRMGSIRSFGILTISGVLASIVLFNVGVVPVLNRFALDPLEDGRWAIFENTKNLINDFLPFGSGPGTFPEVYRAYQPIDQQKFINHAHNDYLELVADMGYLGMGIIIFFMLLFLSRWFTVLSNLRNDRITNLQIGAGIGMLIVLIHSYVDFNLHVPANSLLFVLLAGIFFHQKKVAY